MPLWPPIAPRGSIWCAATASRNGRRWCCRITARDLAAVARSAASHRHDEADPMTIQSFDEISYRTQGPGRIAALRRKLREAGLDGFIVPRSDEHQNEYCPPSE